MGKQALKFFIVPLLLLSSPAYSQQSKNDSYYCVAEWPGGGLFNSRTKHWEGTVFRRETKFVMRATFIRTRNDRIAPYNEYHISITKSGATKTDECWGEQDDRSDPSIVSFMRTGEGQCKAAGKGYVFNLKTNRFLEIDSGTYANEDDNDSDTPSISGGTCTKIE